MKPIWCKHIIWDNDNNDSYRYYWQFYSEHWPVTPVASNWKCCPVCKKNRPLKKIDPIKNMKKWCKHMEWDSDNDNHNHYYWQFNNSDEDTIQVPKNWKCCPVCLTKRPSAKMAGFSNYENLLRNI